MDDAVRDRIAGVIRDHQQADEWGIPVDECRGCGWPKSQSDYGIDYAQHLANEIIADATAALIESGIAAAALNGNRPPGESVFTAQRALDEFNSR